MILNIETSTTVCSVSLTDNENVIANKVSYEQNSHSRLLATFVDDILKENGFNPQDIDAFAVSEGPGSYTGLRIGVSLAKGMAYSLQKPLIAIDTLQIMCIDAIDKLSYVMDDTILCPMIDARRMEVYSAFFRSDLSKVSETSNIIIDEHSFLTPLHSVKIVFFGDGAEKCKTVITHPNALYLDEIYPLASNMGKLSHLKYVNKDFVDVAYFEPFYLKPFIATVPKNKLK